MEVNKLEAHDRKEHLIKEQSINIFQGAEDCLKKNSLSLALQDQSDYIYMFAHPRTTDSGNKGMWWQPRLSKPKAQTNSYLFRAKSKTDEIEVIWLLPPREMWEAYDKGNVTGDDLVGWFINMFQTNRDLLERPDPDDMSEEKGILILDKILQEHKKKPKRNLLLLPNPKKKLILKA